MAYLPGVKPQLSDLTESLFSVLLFCVLYPLHERVLHPVFVDYVSGSAAGPLAATAVLCGTFWLAWFWLWSAAYSLVDIFQPAWAQPYKVQGQAHVSGAKLRQCLRRSMLNLLLVGGPMVYLHFTWALPLRTGGAYDALAAFPSVGEMLWQLAVFILCEEVGFYYSHRLVHEVPFLYKRVHRIHHEFVAPIAPSAVYCHWVEMVVSNVGPILLGPLLCAAHPATVSVWQCIALHSTINGHSGYFFPGMPSPLFHDAHHQLFTTNYGMLGVLDALHGTSDKYLKTLRAD